MASTHCGTNVTGSTNEGRVAVGVAGAETSAIGESKKRDRLLADRFSETLHVTDHVLGADERKERATVGRAGRGKVTTPGQPGIPFSFVIGGGVERVIGLVVGLAVNLTALPHAARVEADEVEPAQHVLGQGQRQAQRGVRARAARAAGVDQQRPDPVGLPGELRADEEQRQRGAVGLVVVDGHHGAAALEEQVALAARRAGDQPGDLGVAVGPGDRRGLRLGRGGRCRGGPGGLAGGLGERGAAGDGQEESGRGGEQAAAQTHDLHGKAAAGSAGPPGPAASPRVEREEGVGHPENTSARS
jgi:hypothetical protein